MRRKESNVSSLPELTNFEVSYSLVTNEVYLSASFTDNMACIPNWPLQEFPDQLICISRAKAIALIEELQKTIDYMDAGIDRQSGSLLPVAGEFYTRSLQQWAFGKALTNKEFVKAFCSGDSERYKESVDGWFDHTN